MKVIFFDGECLLCSGAVRWAHRLDRNDQLWFAALESQFAADHREALGLPVAGENAETFAFWDQEAGPQALTIKSEGALTLCRELGGVWAGLGALASLVPLRFRDFIYDLITRNRRTLFGSSEGCQLPPESLRGRVLR